MNLVDRTYSFHCDNLNFKKSDVLYKKAWNLREFKNEISLTVHKNPYDFINMGKYEWVSHFRKQMQYCNGQDISNAIEDVYVAYDNKRKKYKEKTNIKVQGLLIITEIEINLIFSYYRCNIFLKIV